MEPNYLSKVLEYFSKVKDFRVERTKYYPLNEIIFVVISAVISGMEHWEEIEDFGQDEIDWLRKYLAYTNGTPSHDTINRVMSGLCPKQFEECFIAWTSSLIPDDVQQHICIDGKTVRRSKNSRAGKKAIHLINAWSSNFSLCLAQVKQQEGQNEISTIPDVLAYLELKNSIVSIDAIGCQKSIAKEIHSKEGAYILAVKNNQQDLLEDIHSSFKQFPVADTFEHVDKGHGRLEIRKCSLLTNLDLISSKSTWAGICSILEIQSSRENLLTNKKESETRYYIASLKTDAEQFCRLVRHHWKIENCLHWSLDVIFREDLCRKRQENAAQNFALIRKIGMNLLNLEDSKMSKNRKRHKAARSHKFREKILTI